MNFFDQIDTVKHSLGAWRESWGDSFKYLVTPFYQENEQSVETKTLMTKNKVHEVLDYLHSVGYISLDQKDIDKIQVEFLPQQKPLVRLKSLELIAKSMGNKWSAPKIIDQLHECKVDKRLIVYPNTKWRMVNDIFRELARSKNSDHHQTLFRVISNAVHPLNHEGNSYSSGVMLSSFNDYLSYDNYRIEYNKNNGEYYVSKNYEVTPVEDNEQYQEHMGVLHDKAIDLIKEHHLDDLVLMKKAYQLLMGLVDVYLTQMESSEKLNNYYLKTIQLLNRTGKKIFKTLQKEGCLLVIGTTLPAIPHYSTGDGVYTPFRNLYSASEQMHGMTERDRSGFQAKMRTYFGEVIELCFACEAGDIIEEVNTQELFNEISLFLSENKPRPKKNINNEDSKKSKSKSLKQLNPPRPKYDAKKRKIYFAQKYIPVPKDTTQEIVCQVVLKNDKAMTKEWSWDEIYLESGVKEETIDAYKPRSIYNAGRAVNSKVAQETTIKDLLDVRMLTIQVNPKYLSKVS